MGCRMIEGYARHISRCVTGAILDPMVEIPVILGHRGWHALAGDVRFAMRSDAFSQGFLARIVLRPRWFARFVRIIPLAAILRGLGVFPLENVSMRPAEVWLRDAIAVAGDINIADALTPAFLQQVVKYHSDRSECDGRTREQRLSHLLSWRYQQPLQGWQSVDIFLEPLRGQMKRFILAKMQQELANIAMYVQRGGSLWGAPEGRVSPDGNVGTVTAAAHRFVRNCPPTLCVVPISIGYDFMTSRRSRIFVDIAPTIKHASALAQSGVGCTITPCLVTAYAFHLYVTCYRLSGAGQPDRIVEIYAG